jgi:acyl-coenzyme A synthetase/AMP-(fatty) acid ligase
VFGRPFHDNWWQTETGGIMIANYRRMDRQARLHGRPLPGVEAALFVGPRRELRDEVTALRDHARGTRAPPRLAVDVPRLPRS